MKFVTGMELSLSSGSAGGFTASSPNETATMRGYGRACALPRSSSCRRSSPSSPCCSLYKDHRQHDFAQERLGRLARLVTRNRPLGPLFQAIERVKILLRHAGASMTSPVYCTRRAHPTHLIM